MKKRIDVVDALRGFAVMGIMFLHSVEHFNLYVFPDKTTLPDWLNKLDKNIWETLFFLFSGKAYAIFALLFGFTFYLMSKKTNDQGKDFGYRFLWRLLLLFGFALINGAFFAGEILMLYSILGVSLFFVRKWDDKWILIAAIILLLQPIELYHYLRYLFVDGYQLPAKHWYHFYTITTDGLRGDSFIHMIINNTLYGHKFGLSWYYEFGRVEQTIGLFFIGYLIGRNQLFVSADRTIRFWRFTIAVALFLAGPLYILGTVTPEHMEKPAKETIGLALSMWSNISFTAVYVASFVLLYQTKIFQKITKNLLPYGRMSLTNYVMQSMFGGFVFYGYGLYLAEKVSTTGSFLIGVMLFILQLIFCKWWIKKYKQGPLEKIWHKATWISFGQQELAGKSSF